jgi:hypothetical protein
MKANNYDYVLSLYKSTDEIRPNLCSVFPQDSYYIATDAHTIIYVNKTDAALEYPIVEKSVDGVKFLNENPTDSEMRVDKKDLASYFVTAEMKWFNNYKKCEKCDGSGDNMCGCCEHVSECKECYGSGDSEDVEPFSKPVLSGEDILFAENRFDANLFNRMVQTAYFLEADEILVKWNKGVKNRLVWFQIAKATVMLMPKIG